MRKMFSFSARLTVSKWLLAGAGLLCPMMLSPVVWGSETGLSSTGASTILFVPFGTWRMCQANPQFSLTMFCMGQPTYQAGQEPDLLIVASDRSEATAFSYTLTGTDVNGKVRTFSGVFQRNDNPPSVIGSYTIVNAGILRGITVNIKELAAVSSIQQQNVSMPGVE